MTNKYYGGLIWTNHALERLQERQFTQEMAAAVFSSPDHTRPGKNSYTAQYQKRFGSQTVTLIISRNRQGEHVVLSAWIDPPIPGTQDHRKRQRYLEYQRASNLGKIWLIIKEQLGF